MALFAVSDIHGYYDETIKALSEAGFFESDENRLVVVGDALDRGTQPNEMVDFLLGLHRQGRLIYIYGNHEELFYNCLQEIAAGRIGMIASGMSHHYNNRTFHTLVALSGMSINEAILYPEELVARVKASDFYRLLLPTAINYYETEKYIFCHGWIPLDIEIVDMMAVYSYNPDWRDADENEWHKARWRNGMEMCCMRGIKEKGKTIVCGHWNCSWGHARISGICSERGDDAVTTPFYADGIIAIDACTARWGRVNCIRIEE
jgi:hypothetical protein